MVKMRMSQALEGMQSAVETVAQVPPHRHAALPWSLLVVVGLVVVVRLI